MASGGPLDAAAGEPFESEGWYVAECLEVAVVTQGRSLDETLANQANLRSALELHLDDETFFAVPCSEP